MRRAAVQAFRTARPSHLRKLIGNRPFPNRYTPSTSSHVLAFRSASTSSRREHCLPPVSTSSMYFRNFSLALVSTLVVSGAWYAYRDNPSAGSAAALSNGTNLTDTSTADSAPQKRGSNTVSVQSSASLAPPSAATAQDRADSTRRALVVENDQFYTGTIVGNGPLEKATDDAGRKVLEMLTPEQVTQRLRTNEESYLVGRGRGVVRYDVVQLPSNDPIEDDHAEKIVEVPPSVAAAEDGMSSSDWMFWGVFDGHR